MTFPRPEPGLVVRYDYLWRHEKTRGRSDGSKNRPCAVMLALESQSGDRLEVTLCPITHARPNVPEMSVEIPPPVARHLGLDEAQSWIRTDQVNIVAWPANGIPEGVMPAFPDRPVYGFLPPRLFLRVRDNIVTNSQRLKLDAIARNDIE